MNMKTTKIALGLLMMLVTVMYACNPSTKRQETIADDESIASQGTQASVNPDTVQHFFVGDFVLEAGQATFLDCYTASKLPVANKGEYVTVAEKYQALKPSAAEAISLVCYGHIETLSPMDGKAAVPCLVIDKFVEFDRTKGCSAPIIGGYESYIPDSINPDKKTIMMLNPDYTFAKDINDMGAKLVIHQTGKWFRTGDSAIDLYIMEQDGKPANAVENGTVFYGTTPLRLRIGELDFFQLAQGQQIPATIETVIPAK